MLDRSHQTDLNTPTPQHFNTFLSCDWGTSSFRLTLVLLPSLEVLGGVRNDRGVLATFQAWKEGGGDEAGRVDFFLGVIGEAIAEVEQTLGRSLEGVPVVVSGMASASIGMLTLPYGELPFAVDGTNITVHRIGTKADFPHEVLVVSGVKSDNDVMRGEETQLIGSVNGAPASGIEHLYLFPGTHSKHIRVLNGNAISFRTYMTGEFFELLSSKSILADSVARGGKMMDAENLQSFTEGVTAGSGGNVLNGAFHVRTRALFGQCTPQMNYYFLSGLLIGAEVGELAHKPELPITITGSEPVVSLYDQALRSLGFKSTRLVRGEDAVLRGQAGILQRTILTS